jgi:predicted transcriptional regulator
MKEHVAEIVAAYFRKNTIVLSDIPGVITQVYQSLAELGQPRIEPPEEPRKPAVSIRRSVADEFVICLECGARNVTLRRHLSTAHGLTPDTYRLRWRLPAAHPLIAPNYTARRSEFARAHGLGARETAAVRRRARASARPLVGPLGD